VPVFLVFAACAFASGFALRLADPIVLPVAAHFAVAPEAAAMLISAYAPRCCCSAPPRRASRC
jgi:predicted MFS family arabinose efflux permease